MMKILITGAHFTPAQAVIEELKKYPDIEIIYIGRKYTQEGDKTLSLESQILPDLGVKFIPITAGRLRRFFDLWTIISFLKIPIGFLQSFLILLREKPDVILSFGGYVGLPVVFSGWLLSIPVMVHEQTLVSGLANRLSNIFADKIAVSFKKEYLFNKNKVVLTGNPIRKELLNPKNNKEILDFIKKKESEKLPLIYIAGGNQGSDVINKTILGILEELLKVCFLAHQTGDSKSKLFDSLQEKAINLKFGYRYLAKKWFNANEVGNLLKKTDLAISRAGINSLLELAYFSVPTIVIPLPYLYQNEQVENARYFAKLGLCQIITQKELNPEKLKNQVKTILNDLKKYRESAKRALDPVDINAASKITQEILLLGNY